MLIRPTALLVQESQGISSPLRGHQPDMARPAQMVNREKDLVPREVGAATHHLFEVARGAVNHDVDHLIFCCCMLCHVQPLGEENELLPDQYCIVGATGWFYVEAGGEVC